MRRARGTASHLRGDFEDQGCRAECPGGFDAGLRVRPARLAARLRRGRRAPAEPRGRSIAGRDSRHGRALRAPSDVDARALERRRGAAARARRPMRSSAGRSARPTAAAARPGTGRGSSSGIRSSTCASTARTCGATHTTSSGRSSLALGDLGHRGDDPRGSRVGRRVRAGRQDRLDRDPGTGLDRATWLRAERRLRPLGLRPVPRLRTRGRRSPPSRQSSGGRSRVAEARDPVLRRLAEVLELDLAGLPAEAA